MGRFKQIFVYSLILGVPVFMKEINAGFFPAPGHSQHLASINKLSGQEVLGTVTSLVTISIS